MPDKLKRIVIFTAIGVLIAATGWSFVRSQLVDSPDYVDNPFEPFESKLPRLLSVEEEPPASDSDALDAYWKRLEEVHQYFVDNGAIVDATEEEGEAFLADYEQRYARSQTLAEKILEQDPQSIPALFALAGARAFGESDLPYGLFLVRQARKLAQRQGVLDPSDSHAREWYIRTLEREYLILEALDRREDQLRVLELIGQVYQPMPWLEIWPLVKLGRYDEARERIRYCLKQDKFAQFALNGQGALEDLLHNREAAYETNQEMAARCSQSPLSHSNAGLAAANSFRLEEAEKHFRKSISLGQPNFDGTALIFLSQIYIQQGRLTEAVDAIKRGQQHRSARDLHTLQQDEARTQMAAVQLMLAFGRHELAERFARRAALNADRAGNTSLDQKALDAGNQIALWTALQFSRQQLREQIACSANVTTADRLRAGSLESELWVLARKYRKTTRGELLVHTLRENPTGAPGIELGVASWFRASSLQMLPSGVASAAIRESRVSDEHPGAQAYFDALQAELELRRRRYSKANSLAVQALGRLPASEKLLRARVSAVAGEAGRRQGDTQAALKLWSSTLRDFPQAFRMLEIEIPVSIQHDDSPAAAKLANRVDQSPRFVQDAEGYPLKMAQTPEGLVFEFFRLDAARHFEGIVSKVKALENQPDEKDDAGQNDDLVSRAALQIHTQLMQPLIELTQQDISSLDGSPEATRLQGHVDQILKDVYTWE